MPYYTPSLQTPMDRRVVQLFCGTGLVTCLLLALLYTLVPSLSAPGTQAFSVAIALCGVGAYAIGGRLILHAGLGAASRCVGWTSLVLIAASAACLDPRMRPVLCGLAALVVCVCGITVGLRAAIAMAVSTTLALAAIATADHLHWLSPTAGEAGPLAMLAGQTLLLGTSVGVAALLARITAYYGAAVADREAHFRRLLQIAADGYWELDAALRLTRVTPIAAGGGDPMPLDLTIGVPLWEDPTVRIDTDVLDRHRADLESRHAFRHLPVRLRAPDGSWRHLLLSGEPRFDSHDVFVGYWGVIRDATAEAAAQQAIAASEARYRELFERSPSALVLHRRRRVLDANPAALALFGLTRLEELLGSDLLAFEDVDADHELSRQRLGRMERAAIGESLPVRALAMRTAQGERLEVLAAAVRVAAADGPATLSFYYDDTQRRRADAALRRSQAMLSNLVATTPDIISLSEIDTGRYVMVNPSFTRLTGWAEDEVVGRTSFDIGIWFDVRDRERLVEQVRLGGRVDALPATLVARDGRPVPTLVSAARFEMNGRDHLVVAARDISQSERTRLELEAILQAASVGIAFVRGRHLVRVNSQFATIFGWSEDALVGLSGQVLWASPEDFEAVGSMARPLLAAGQAFEVERLMKRRDDSTFWCRLLARAIDPSHPSRAGTIWIAEDVTERRRTEQALASARDAAEAANRAKSAFLANTSHEIRTPLNGLLGLARLALRPALPEAQRRQFLEQIVGNAETLSNLISDILDLSKIEAGKLTLEALDFDLHALLADIGRGYQPLAEHHGLSLAIRLGDNVPRRVRGDPLRVRQILSNYLTNAIKFTSHGEVQVEVDAEDPPCVRFSVRDTGSGIEPATLERLFRPFTQADESTTRRFGGTGLGLSICRELAALMGGEVGADSEPGVGSRFWARLPLPPASRAGEPGTAASPGGAVLAGLRVLLVEDNPVNMMIAVATLEQWGVAVTQAADGATALAAFDAASAAGSPPDAVLMDLQMPGMSGHEAARRLRARGDGQAAPIIALTAAALVSEREAARAAGMTDFLTKPLDTERLREALQRACGRR